MIKKTLITFSLLFLATVWCAHMYYNMSIYIPSYFTGLSFFTFIMYAWDKQKAKQSAHKKVNRTPERTLQLLSLLGGWPGALIAQQWLRHKSQKRAFIGVLWLTIAVNISMIGWLLHRFY